MALRKYRDDDLVRIDLPSEAGTWVEVKRRLGLDDEREIQRRVLRGQRIRPGATMDDLDLAPLVDAAKFAQLEVAIKRWSFAEPLTPANLQCMEEEDVDAIRDRLDDLYPSPRTDDERKNSSAPSPAEPSLSGSP